MEPDPALDRRALLRAGLSLAAAAACPIASRAASPDVAVHPPPAAGWHVYAGSWVRKGGQRGLYQYHFDPATAELRPVSRLTDRYSVGGIFSAPDRPLLYVTDETENLPGQRAGGGGTISTWAVEPGSGALTEIGRQKAWGANPSMVAVVPGGEFLVASIHGTNDPITQVREIAPQRYELDTVYPDASLNLFRRQADGNLGDLVHHVRTTGSGPRKNQVTSHPHCVVFSPEGEFFLCADKGADRLLSLRVDTARQRIEPAADPLVLPAGSVPRYVRFHPELPLVYLNHEHANEITVFRHDGRGQLRPVGSEPVVTPALMARTPAHGHFEQQDMRLHPSGRFLYSVVRGSHDYEIGPRRGYEQGFDGVSVFEIDARTGMPHHIQTLELDAHWPRGCAISPDGRHMLLACLYSDELLTLAIGGDGRLTLVNRTRQSTAANVTFLDIRTLILPS